MKEVEIKKAWTLAGGLCSFPGCKDDCMKHINNNIDSINHIINIISAINCSITKKPEILYNDIIILCPKHHEMLVSYDSIKKDIKAITEWKKEHERYIEEIRKLNPIRNGAELEQNIKKLLNENKEHLAENGAKSKEEYYQKKSKLNYYWDLVNLQVIIPNNRKIINLLTKYGSYYDASEYVSCIKYVSYAEALERST